MRNLQWGADKRNDYVKGMVFMEPGVTLSYKMDVINGIIM